MLRFPVISTRTEVILPEVNGYKVIKADLHVHTHYSDGIAIPAYRVTEGWQDGLDAMAITDHLEYRPNENNMVKFLADGVTVKEGAKGTKAANKGIITSDLNQSVSEAQNKAARLGIALIPGIEITRDQLINGHFNVLFSTDNNLIPDPDPLQSIRNAKKQGAIVQINHPGWDRPDNEFTKVAKAAIEEKLIDGVEIFNSYEFYPEVIETAVEQGLYVCCGSDLHPSSHDRFGRYGVFRDMTLIFAKDSSLSSIREALENGRTLAYAYGDVAGSEALLKDFFKASFTFKVLYTDSKGKKQVQITNNSSFPYSLSLPGGTVAYTVEGLSSVIWGVKGDVMPITVTNMWYGDGKHPCIEIGL